MSEPDRFIGYPEVEARTDSSRVTVYRRTRTDPSFPQPIRLGGRTVFSENSLNRWMAQKVASAQRKAGA